MPMPANCFYNYKIDKSTNGNCDCHRPAACDITRKDCPKGTKFNRADCTCDKKKESCTPCNAGEKQNPFTCECINYTSISAKCPLDGMLNHDDCKCVFVRGTKTFDKDTRCPNGYNKNCASCELKSEY